MSLQRKINKNHNRRTPQKFAHSTRLHKAITSNSPYEAVNKPDKGKMNGSCNRTACQRPLACEPVHQFMRDPIFKEGRLYYCADCARDFDDWDFRSGDRVRINREPKTQTEA